MNARSLALLCLPLSALLFAACGEDEAAPKQPARKGGSGGASGKGGTEDGGTGGDDGGGNTSSKGGKGGTGGGTLTCMKHSACEPGEKLVRACSLCIQQVCDITPTCCGEEWDENCVASAQRVPVCDCGDAPTAGAGGAKAGAGGAAGSAPVTCHDACVEGSRLDASCGVCAANVCKIDEFCCENKWDAQCVLKASNVVEGCDCEPIDICHSPCEAGEPLTIDCDPCVEDVCGAQPSCCETEWDSVYCVELAKEACSSCKTPTGGAGGAAGKAGAGGAGGSKKCPENPCIPGGKAVAAASCNACIEGVIAAKPTCADGWKQGCADLAKADATCGCPAGGAGGASGSSGGTSAKGGAAGTSAGAAGKGGASGAAGKAGAGGATGGAAGSNAGGAGGAENKCPVGACHPDSPLQSIDPKLCNNCTTQVCSAHPECCTTAWTAACANYALKDFKSQCGCPDLSKCGHDPCAWGQELDPTCSPCVKRICELDPFCCDDSGLEIEWDGACIAKWDKAIKDKDPACVEQDSCKAP